MRGIGSDQELILMTLMVMINEDEASRIVTMMTMVIMMRSIGSDQELIRCDPSSATLRQLHSLLNHHVQDGDDEHDDDDGDDNHNDNDDDDDKDNDAEEEVLRENDGKAVFG